jgi:septal ring factor EnvC (AmiA/AmiB activator)
MNWGILAGVLAGLVSLASIASFFIARMKDAEERGAMKQKIKDLEEKIEKIENAVECHGDKINDQNTVAASVAQRLDTMEKNIESINQKLDRLLDRQAAGRPV